MEIKTNCMHNEYIQYIRNIFNSAIFYVIPEKYVKSLNLVIIFDSKYNTNFERKLVAKKRLRFVKTFCIELGFLIFFFNTDIYNNRVG